MFALLMALFVILSLFLALFILIQPGKGDMGLGGMGNQMLFGGSGGQSFFQKTTWTLGAIFMAGSLGLAMLKTHETQSSQLAGFKVPGKAAPAFSQKLKGNALPSKTSGQTQSNQAQPLNSSTQEIPVDDAINQAADDHADEIEE